VQSVYKSFFGRHAEGQLEVRTWDNLWTMLTVITVRKCANRNEYFKALCRNVRREATPPTPDESAADWEGTSCEPAPEHAVMLAETVEQLMDGLDERERDVLALSLQGYSVPEISEKLGRAERTVRRVRERVKGRLERMLESDREAS
jgi:RNA polymerase sigma-70 factor (ECF subfamily)